MTEPAAAKRRGRPPGSRNKPSNPSPDEELGELTASIEQIDAAIEGRLEHATSGQGPSGESEATLGSDSVHMEITGADGSARETEQPDDLAGLRAPAPASTPDLDTHVEPQSLQSEGRGVAGPTVKAGESAPLLVSASPSPPTPKEQRAAVLDEMLTPLHVSREKPRSSGRIALDAAAVDASRMDYYIQDLPIGQLRDNPHNPRLHFDEVGLQELAADIAEHGLLDAPVVIPTEDRTTDDAPIYEIRGGSRRYRAMRDILGLATIPSVHVLRGRSAEEAYRVSLTENLQRVDLNPMEEARGYAELRDMGMRQTEIAESVHRSAPAVSNSMRLLTLPEDVQALIESGDLKTSHALALARFSDFPEALSAMALLAVQRGTSAHDLEKGTPFADILISTKVVASVNPYRDGWPCQSACPFGAFRAGKNSWGGDQPVCLKPEHVAVLTAELAAAQAERNAAALQRFDEVARQEPKILPPPPPSPDWETDEVQDLFNDLDAAEDAEDALDLVTATTEQAGQEITAVTGHPHVSELPRSAYASLRYSTPAGCTAACACRRVAIDDEARDFREIGICIDPARHRALIEAEVKAKRLGERTAKAQLVTEVRAAVDRIESVGPREIAVIASSRDTVPSYNVPARWKQSFTRQGLEMGADQGARDLPSVLLNLHSEQLVPAVRAIVEGVLLSEIEESYTSNAHAEWYVGRGSATALPVCKGCGLGRVPQTAVAYGMGTTLYGDLAPIALNEDGFCAECQPPIGGLFQPADQAASIWTPDEIPLEDPATGDPLQEVELRQLTAEGEVGDVVARIERGPTGWTLIQFNERGAVFRSYECPSLIEASDKLDAWDLGSGVVRAFPRYAPLEAAVV